MPVAAYSRKLLMLGTVSRQYHSDADVQPQDLCCDYGYVQGEPILYFGCAVLPLRVDETNIPVDLVKLGSGEQVVERIRTPYGGHPGGDCQRLDFGNQHFHLKLRAHPNSCRKLRCTSRAVGLVVRYHS